MFVTVKSLTAIIDINISYVQEAYLNRDKFEQQVFDDYIITMRTSLNNKLQKLQEISSNKKLIAKYVDKVNKTFQ